MINRFTAPLFLLLAFVLLLLVTLSVPIIQGIYLLTATAGVDIPLPGLTVTVDEVVDFGIWGWCVGAHNTTVLPVSATVPPTQCSAPQVGYAISTTVLELLQGQIEDPSEEQVIISPGLTGALVLHPIACSLTFFACLLSLHHAFTAHEDSRLSAIVTLPITLLACLTTMITFGVDLAFIVIVRRGLAADTDGAVLPSIGNVLWIVLGALIALWLGTAAVATGVWCYEPRRIKVF